VGPRESAWGLRDEFEQDADTLWTAFYALKRKAAAGVDGVTWQDYEADLGRNLEALHGRVHRGAYWPQPSRRTYIPKADGRQRPLAIAALEDKIVQGACAMVLNAIYEEDFLGFSYGFRPGRGPHDALDALSVAITSRKVNHILDADVRDFFGSVNHDWLIRFLEHRIGDKRIIRLIRKWLRAGILEGGVVTVADSGTGQGSVISPLLGNIYLHYVFDLWAERWRRHEARGDIIVVRYADDLVAGFEHEGDARRFLDAMRERLPLPWCRFRRDSERPRHDPPPRPQRHCATSTYRFRRKPRYDGSRLALLV
jgi:group II intron reverse transcriptase/maturase